MQTSLGLFTRSSWSDWCHSHRHCKGRVRSKRNLDLGFERQKCAPQLWIWALCFLERKLGQHSGWQGSSLFSLNDLRKEGVHPPPSAVPSSAFRASCRLLCSLPPSIHPFGLPFFVPISVLVPVLFYNSLSLLLSLPSPLYVRSLYLCLSVSLFSLPNLLLVNVSS